MSGIEYINEDLSTHPQCAHGPTLLFSRCINENGDRRKFFACSACRDRKFCSFFLWEDEKDRMSDTKRKIVKKEALPSINHRKMFLILNEVLQSCESGRNYCSTCGVLFVDKYQHLHVEHEVKDSVSEHDLLYPSTFLKPLANDKKEAQYLFSKPTVTTIINIFKSLDIKNILCIGVPRIHEHIQTEYQEMSSLLLDLDHRYHSFYGPLQFCWYNLFNHHFFLPSAQKVFSDFLQTDNLAVLIDPPFGGRVEPIAATLKTIEKQYQTLNKNKNKLPVYLFLPYFMEPQIKNSLDMQMVAYKVDYDNHPLFRDQSRRKFGSPVRIFTNENLSKIKLPESEGYHLCKLCKRWVSEENNHCKKCNDCTSKDGRTYKHCEICERCVKPTWLHCEECGKCAQSDHKCGNLPFTQSCFHCKERGHKKIDCPKVDHESLKTKRQNKLKKNKKIKL